VLDAPEERYASRRGGRSGDGGDGVPVPRRRRAPGLGSGGGAGEYGRDFAEDFSDDFEDDPLGAGRGRGGGVRVRLRGLPGTKWGRILGIGAVLLLMGLCVGVVLVARDAVMHDERFVIEDSAAVEVEGNNHVSRTQLLSIFGEDVERNIFTVSLAERRAQLEQLPWVKHATVMRLLPNRLRVQIEERVPVAFVRQGSHIGLVDASGVLLDMPPDKVGSGHYSFPVVTGISADDPLSTRAARMKIYQRFTGELDGSGEKVSDKLSEVDLTNPEDVRALVPDATSAVLVHFGDESFLERYRKYQEHLAEWRAQYPRLSSVDMRYERQVVLEMQRGAGTAAAGAGAAASGATGAANGPAVSAGGVTKPKAASISAKPGAAKAGRAKAGAAKAVAAKVGAANAGAAKAGTAKTAGGKAVVKKVQVGKAAAAKPKAKAIVKARPGEVTYHPPRVVQR